MSSSGRGWGEGDGGREGGVEEGKCSGERSGQRLASVTMVVCVSSRWRISG